VAATARRSKLARKDWMLDLPAAYVDYNHGPLWVRVGNQQIAWGEAIFFRVLDVPNGLDYRATRYWMLPRKSIQTNGYRRRAFAAVTGSPMTGRWKALPQRFQSEHPGGSEFTLHTHPESIYGGTTGRLRRGQERLELRCSGFKGRSEMSACSSSRRSATNPDGVFRWTDSHAVRAVRNSVRGGNGAGRLQRRRVVSLLGLRAAPTAWADWRRL